MTHSEGLNELAAALAKAQAEMRGAIKDGTNPHFHSEYATLASVWDACRGPLTAHGLSVVQVPSAEGPVVSMVTMLMHESGQWLSGALTMTAVQNTPQGIGSAITYARRYGLAALVGVAPDEDDDGNAASGPPRNGKHKAAALAEDAPVQASDLEPASAWVAAFDRTASLPNGKGLWDTLQDPETWVRYGEADRAVMVAAKDRMKARLTPAKEG